MNDCQGRGKVTRGGQLLATVEYSVQSEPDAVNNSIRGYVEVVEGEKSLSLIDQFTLHMEGGLELDFQVEPATDQAKARYQLKGTGVFRRSS
ncbi:MAG: hypothetical protein JW753_01350 [Dehalococcoidia bacterium]|nr:hypothetical protein [Dehalococcoidia bacterium]